MLCGFCHAQLDGDDDWARWMVRRAVLSRPSGHDFYAAAVFAMAFVSTVTGPPLSQFMRAIEATPQDFFTA